MKTIKIDKQSKYIEYTSQKIDLSAIAWMLCDYLHKLERDDFDPMAVEKMKEVNNILAQLGES